MVKNNKGVIESLGPIFTALISLAVLVAVGFLIVSEIASNDAIVADSNATAAIQEVQSSMADIPGWIPIIIVAVIGGLLLQLTRIFRT